jgi:hypothetical protein
VRLGEWLVARGLLREETLTQTVAAQWGSPVLVLDGFRPERTAGAMPESLTQALGGVPVGAGRQVYLAFAEKIDRSLSYAVERMTGLPVVAGIAAEAQHRRAQAQFLAAPGPRSRFLEALNAEVLARGLTRLIESEKPHDVRLARVHRWLWVRLWKRPRRTGLPLCEEVEDLLCTVGPIGSESGGA